MLNNFLKYRTIAIVLISLIFLSLIAVAQINEEEYFVFKKPLYTTIKKKILFVIVILIVIGFIIPIIFQENFNDPYFERGKSCMGLTMDIGALWDNKYAPFAILLKNIFPLSISPYDVEKNGIEPNIDISAKRDMLNYGTIS